MCCPYKNIEELISEIIDCARCARKELTAGFEERSITTQC